MDVQRKRLAMCLAAQASQSSQINLENTLGGEGGQRSGERPAPKGGVTMK
jgi:hypothetical protein